jgi:hypothetical protein
MKHDEHPESTHVGHERSDTGVRPIVLTGLGLALALGLLGLAGYGMFHYLTTHTNIDARENPMAAGASQVPPEPRIEEHPAIGIQQLRTQEERNLTSYGWVDKGAGRIRIPIDRAMQLQLERGFPTRKERAAK